MLCEKHKNGVDGCYECLQELTDRQEKLMIEMWRTIHILPWWKLIFINWLWPAFLSTTEFLRKYHS